MLRIPPPPPPPISSNKGGMHETFYDYKFLVVFLRAVNIPIYFFNPLILAAAKSSLVILMKSFKLRYNSESIWWSIVNPLMLTAAKYSLTILMKSSREKLSYENIWRRNVHENTTNNSPSNIFKNHSQFLTYCQKYHRSRRQFLDELLSINGLITMLLTTLLSPSNIMFGHFQFQSYC